MSATIVALLGVSRQTKLTGCNSQNIILGCYVVIFGAGRPKRSDPVSQKQLTLSATATLLLEFQIPPAVSRWAPFLFSFIGRGICKYPVYSLSQHCLTLGVSLRLCRVNPAAQTSPVDSGRLDHWNCGPRVCHLGIYSPDRASAKHA